MSEFAFSVGEYRLMPASLVPAASVTLAILETVVSAVLAWSLLNAASPGEASGALGLFVAKVREIGALVGVALLALYAFAMGANLLRGRRDLDCGCGIVRKSISVGMVVRNLVLALLVGAAALPASARALSFADYATVAGALAVCALLYASAELLLGRAAPRRLFTEIS
jgi:hypothetical protein